MVIVALGVSGCLRGPSNPNALPRDDGARTATTRPDEEQDGGGTSRRGEPASSLQAAEGIREVHHRGVTLDPAAGGRQFGKHEEARRPGGLPSELFRRNTGRESRLRVVLAERLFDVDQLGFDLDHEQHSLAWMPREQVDRAAFAIDGIRDLGTYDPTRRAEHVRDRTHERCVSFIDEPVQVAASPPELDNEIRVQRSGDPANGLQRETFEMAALEQRYQALRDAGTGRQVALSPAKSLTERSEARADPEIHGTDGIGGRFAGSHLPITFVLSNRRHAVEALLTPGVLGRA
jgi:hypothetical protein